MSQDNDILHIIMIGALGSVCGSNMVLVGATTPEKIEVVSHVDFLQLNWPVAVKTEKIH